MRLSVRLVLAALVLAALVLGIPTDPPLGAFKVGKVITASAELDMGKRYRETIFDFARHREPDSYRLIVERKGAIPPPE